MAYTPATNVSHIASAAAVRRRRSSFVDALENATRVGAGDDDDEVSAAAAVVVVAAAITGDARGRGRGRSIAVESVVREECAQARERGAIARAFRVARGGDGCEDCAYDGWGVETNGVCWV